MKIILSPNPYRDHGMKCTQSAAKILKNCGADVVLCLPFSLEAGKKIELPQELPHGEMDKELKDADMLICFGGDGTILHAAKSAYRFGVPILGVNMGSVGFMAEFESSELSFMTKIAKGEYTEENRMMLDAVVRRGGRVIAKDVALNDVTITKGSIARVVELGVYGDNVHIADYSGDGVIISTPTGSTAYSMSAGGPIVEPTAENIIVTPICAHVLTARSLVLDPRRLVAAKMGTMPRKSAFFSADGGRSLRLLPGDVVEVSKSDKVTKLVRVTGKSFYEILSHKLVGKM